MKEKCIEQISLKNPWIILNYILKHIIKEILGRIFYLVEDGSFAADEGEHPGEEVPFGVLVRVADVEDGAAVGLVGVVAVAQVGAAVGKGHSWES